MKEHYILLFVFLPGFITLIYLYINEVKIPKKPLAYPILNSSMVGPGDYLRQENKKSIPQSDLIIVCQIRKFKAGSHTDSNASIIFFGFGIQDCSLPTGSGIFSAEISTKVMSTKKRKLNYFSRIVICKDSSGTFKYRFHFTF
jgi:hypothetical protein